MSHTFSPPFNTYPNESGDWFLDMLDQQHGITVATTDGGITYHSLGEYPYQGDLGYVDAVTSQVSGGKEGIDYFLGGHVYQVTDAQAAALTASGFTVG